MKKLILSLVALCVMVTASQGMVSVTGTVANGTGVLSVDQDITFSVHTDGFAQMVILKNWAPSDASASGILLTGNISISVGSNPSQMYSLVYLEDHLFGSAFNDLALGDTYFYWDTDVPVRAGDTLTIHTGSWALDTNATFDPSITGTFVGELLLADISATALGVPEPGTYAALAGVAALGLAIIRRRFRK